jgi:hypothetical protein
VPVSESEYVRLTCQFEPSSVPVIVTPLVDLLHRVLSVKAAEFSSRRQMAPKEAAVMGIRAEIQSPSQF